MESFLQDLRYGWRALRVRPGFTVVAVVTLAAGIAVNTAMFSVVSAVLLAELPYPAPERLVLVRVSVEGRDSLPSVSPPEVVELRERAGIFEDVASIRDNSQTLTGAGEPVQLVFGGVSWNFPALLGIEPHIGRALAPEDGRQGASPVVMLSHGLWQRRFGGDRDILGKTVQLDGQATTVVAVAPPEAELLLPREAGLPRRLDGFTPFAFDFASAPRSRWMRALGRLAPGVSPKRAERAMQALVAELTAEHPQYRQQSFVYELAPLHADLVRGVRTPLLVLFGAVAFVLLIACANVASLLIARAAEREQEIGTRAALGASGGRLLRQLLTEGALLALLGGALGLLVARLSLGALVAAAPRGLPRLEDVAIDLPVLLFSAGATIATVLLFALVPALQAARGNLAETLKGQRATGGLERVRLRRLLVAGEVALALVLLVGAGLLTRSFLTLAKTRPGFDPGELVSFQLQLPFQRYASAEATHQFFQRLAERVEALPGVTGFGGSFPLPMSGRFWTNDYAYDAETERAWGSLESDNHVVLPGTFDALGVRLLRGRGFDWTDVAEGRPVIVVDAKLAAKAWPEQDPLGQRLKVLLQNRQEWLEVIGVVEHVRQDHPGSDGREQTYLPPSQWPFWGLPLVVRSPLEPAELARLVKREVAALDPELAVHDVRTMDSQLAEVTAGNRLAMLLMVLFAALAAALAGVGLYGTIAYTVSQRSHELGIRMALGAEPRDLLRLVAGQGLALVGVGLAAGVVASLALTRLLASLLYGVDPFDLPTYAAITAGLALVALVACYVPARGATRVAPVVALRCE